MARRNHSKTVRFTSEEIEAIKERASKLSMSDSDVIRKGALLFIGRKVNPVPEHVENWMLGLNKVKLMEILGPEKGAIDRLKKFFGRE